MDCLELPQSEQVNYFIDAEIYCEDVEVVAPPTTPPTTRKGREKNVSRRGGAFTKEEDGVICSAFLNVSKNPETGANQRRGGYYKRLHDYYNTFKPEGSNRSQLAVQNRWGTIQRSVHKFCEFKSAVDRLNESGKNEQDRIDDAVKMYEAEEAFHFMHCWKILRHESKWNDKVLELSSNSAGTGREGSSQANSGPAAVPEGGNENSMLTRTQGRDSAKRKRVADASSASIAVDVLQSINENREECQQEEDEHPLSEQANYVIGAQICREGVEVVAPPTTRKGREKNVSRRGVGFTKEEDEVICSAFLNVSKNPITGASQREGGYYKRLHDYYNTFKPEGSNRSQLAVQHRWGTIQRSVRKFCGFKSAVDRLNESGKNEQDRIDDAVEVYEAVEPFHFMHCWKILRHESKWNDMVLELSSNSAGTGREDSSQANLGPAAVPEGGNENSMLPITEGRDSAKRKRVADASSSSIAVDVLQSINENREECQQEENEHPQSEQVNYVIGAQICRKGVEVVAPPTTRKGREKNVSRRGVGFTKEEDEVICSAFLNVSKNPITGASQRQGGYYKRLHDYYNTFKPEGSNRSQLAVQYRWGTIQRSVRKFCGFKSAVDRLNESGKNEQDRIDDAVEVYEAVEPFHFMHCWKILRHESKWNDMVLELSSNSAGTGREDSSQANLGPAAVPEGGNENSMLPITEGRDSAKRKRVADASSSSIAVDVLQSINENREECQQEENEHPQSEQVNYVIGAQICRKGVEVVAPPTTRKGREKNVSRRGVGFTKEEDEVICSAFLNVSKNPITGASQRQGGYYKRLHDYYNTFKPEGSNRSQLAVQYRWGTIQRSVRKFCGFKSAVDRLNESGKNEQDRIDDAVKMYEAVEPFHFMHCWKILRHESKWNDKVLELTSNSAGTGREGSLQAAVPDGGNGNSMLPRTEGRDSAKRKRVADTSSSSTAVVVLQRINENREKCQQKEDEQMVQILTRKDEKLSLQREVLELKKQQLEENFILRKKEAENAAKQAEAQLLLAEAQIMSVDIDKVAPHLKNYYIGMQLQIAERRGFASSEPKDA